MTWYCESCGMPWKRHEKTCCGVCGGTEAERWPPLDGFMVLDVHPSKSEEADLDERDAFFNRKRQECLQEDAMSAQHTLEQLNPSPVVRADGAVALHIREGGGAVILRYSHPQQGYDDMRALREWAQAWQDFEKQAPSVRAAGERLAQALATAWCAGCQWNYSELDADECDLCSEGRAALRAWREATK